jgi:hypothetical protein
MGVAGIHGFLPRKRGLSGSFKALMIESMLGSSSAGSSVKTKVNTASAQK